MNLKLKQLRQSKGITTKEMADKLGISKAFYSQLENNRRTISYAMAIKIANIFNKKPDNIFFRFTKNHHFVIQRLINHKDLFYFKSVT